MNHRFIERDPAYVERLMQDGNLPQAEICCRLVLQRNPTDAVALFFLGWIAERIDLRKLAVSYYAKVCALKPQWDLPRQRVQFLAQQPDPIRASEERYLLVKAWGFGFWADVYHVIGQLLLAEMTNRIPVVHWGTNSLFRDEGTSNAFNLYFEPVSHLALSDLEQEALDFFPPKWGHANLRQERLNKWQGPWSRMAGLYYLNRPERVAVSDFYTGVLDLLPWIPGDHPLHGRGVDESCRHLIDKYLRPRPEIIAGIEKLYREKLARSDFIAVHVRGSDKSDEMIYLEDLNSAYFDVVDRFLSKWRGAAIYLLTDDGRSVSAFKARYGDLIVTADCQRTEQPIGLHYQPGTDKRRLGVEVMTDTYLAARAQGFIGNGYSNVSTMVSHLRSWGAGDLHLFEGNLHHVRNTNLHDWDLFRESA